MRLADIKFNIAELTSLPNIAEKLDKDTQGELGKQVVDDFNRDRSTRTDWETRHAEAIKVALQVVETKSFPWENCSNIKFPLLTIAVLQFLARISLMTKGQKIASVKVLGADPTGEKALQSERLSDHLSLQLLEEQVNWRDSDEQAKLSACLLGSAFKKTYPDVVKGMNISEHVPSMDLVVDYKCKDIDRAQRITQILSVSQNDIEEGVRRGIYCKLEATALAAISPTAPSESYIMQQAEQEASGVRPSGGDVGGMLELLEQHLWLDLDGDGYKEPYIATVRHDTGTLLRLVARFTDHGQIHRLNDARVLKLDQEALKTEDPEARSQVEQEAHRLQTERGNHIVRIDPMLYFTRFLFIPSPDGGIYGLGLGSLLGPMNDSVDTLTNQLIDSGTMSNTAGGFLGRGVKMKGGSNEFNPFEWKPVETTGTDLRNNIFPLPVRDPSPVLFQLLGMLVTYAEKISGATDIMTGVSPGQNTPAETSRNTIEQGMMLFSGIYARMYRGFSEELRKIVALNKLFLPLYPQWYKLTQGREATLLEDDYTRAGLRVIPTASAEAVSNSQRREKAGVVLQLAGSQPGFNKYLVVKRFLEAYDVDDIDSLYPDPAGPRAIAPPPNIELEQLKLIQQAHVDEMQIAAIELQQSMKLNDAKVIELQAKATKEFAEAGGVDSGHQIALLNAQIAAEKVHKEALLKAYNLLHRGSENAAKLNLQVHTQTRGSGRGPAGADGSSELGGVSRGGSGLGM